MDFTFSEEYHCCIGPLTAMIKDFANIVSSLTPEITAASKLIKNGLGSYWLSKVGIMLNLYPKGHCASCKFIDREELVTIDINDFWEFFS
jgi:hypothetical protein